MKKMDTVYDTKPVILIVDDTLTGRHAITSALQNQEYQLSQASNGTEAISLAMKLKPDIILLDIMMPGLSGYEVCQRIRANPSLREIPILMVSSLTDRSERLKGLTSGADDFISKPFDAAELEAKIRTITLLNRYRKLREKHQELTSIKQNLAVLESRQNHLQKLAMVDDLTELHNRRALLQHGRDEFDRAQRYGTGLSALMIDVDKFKSINDTFGHKGGNLILRGLAAELRHNLRSMDIAGRLGGDEFLILLPHTSTDSARILAERLRKSVENRVFTINGKSIHITISIGIATLSNDIKKLTHLIEAADVALYKAKTGRNSVV